MANAEKTILQVLSQLENNVQTTISYIDSELGKAIDIPLLKDLNNPNQLYDGYREAVLGYQKICDSVAMLAQTQVRLRQLRRQLNQSDVLPSLKASIKNRVEFTLSDIDVCRQSAITVKDGYDARLRFYGSTQYMLSSARYNEVKY